MSVSACKQMSMQLTVLPMLYLNWVAYFRVFYALIHPVLLVQAHGHKTTGRGARNTTTFAFELRRLLDCGTCKEPRVDSGAVVSSELPCASKCGACTESHNDCGAALASDLHRPLDCGTCKEPCVDCGTALSNRLLSLDLYHHCCVDNAPHKDAHIQRSSGVSGWPGMRGIGSTDHSQQNVATALFNICPFKMLSTLHNGNLRGQSRKRRLQNQ